MLQVVEPVIGILLGFFVLLDIFLLVLHARANTGAINRYISKFVWRGFVAVAPAFGRWKGSFLSYAGPVILVSILAAWFFLLTLAVALIIHPNLGTGIHAIHGETPTDFSTALYVAGNSLTFIGASDFAPQTGAFRLFYLLTSIIGVGMVPLIITYLLEVYASLRARNSLGLKVHLHSAETGDAAEVISGLAPQGRFDSGYIILAEWAAETTEVKESHHFHPILFYFRFRDSFYSVSRSALTSLDTITLLKSALDDQEYGWLKKSAAVEQLWLATLMELKTLVTIFMSDREFTNVLPDEQTRARWSRRYSAAVEQLKHARIKTIESGAEEYIALRAQWDQYITSLAPQFGYHLDEIDTALAKVK